MSLDTYKTAGTRNVHGFASVVKARYESPALLLTNEFSDNSENDVRLRGL